MSVLFLPIPAQLWVDKLASAGLHGVSAWARERQPARVTVLEIIQKSTEYLARKGVESPRLQTELLLAHVLRLPRMKLYLNFARELSGAESAAMRVLVERRGRREPLQHLVGTTSFCGCEIAVNRHVLVPRAETELLAETGWEWLATLNPQPTTVLDFGTGSGCIAIALAVNCPATRVTGLEISPEALAVAQNNAARHRVAKRIEFVNGPGFAALPARARFDLIISNPPYIPSAEIASLQPEVRDFDPHGALDGGPDGLDFYRMFAERATEFLKPGGKMMLEFGDGQAESVRRIFEAQKWIVEAVREDYSQRLRFLVARRAGG